MTETDRVQPKVRLLGGLADDYLDAAGRIVIGDIAFQSVEARTQAGADDWDEDEHYWAADETVDVCDRAGLRVKYAQISRYGGVFVIEPAVSSHLKSDLR
jgi:hypothetical protein